MTTRQNGPTAVVGATTWGTTLALLLARRGVGVRLVARTDEEAALFASKGEHPRLPGQAFPDALSVTADWQTALGDAACVLFVVPSATMRENARRAAPHIGAGTVVVSAAKGLEQ